ncbi:MAG: DPP IV N-terminal domain-containing protein [Paludibacteraceae bacterium]|nr:DPP IV N-terminal domain-containing protein [Paludibacteraceae bacterium]
MKGLLIILSVLTGILSGEYKANTLSEAEQDSILGVQTTGRYRLESENEEAIFRHSSVADYYIIDTMRHTRKQLGEGKVRDAVMSPNGRYVAFAKDNNLYIHKLDFGTEVAVTKDENTEIINGIADWLYEEEFATTALFAWSPDSKMLAFVRLDETEVPTFSWDVYSDTQYPKAESLRYPKAGCENAKASVCVYDVATKGIQRMQVESGDVYLPRLRWTDENTLLVLRVNRDQTKMEVLSCNAKSTVCHPLYAEESKKYFVDYSLFDEWQWLSDGKFIVLSEKNGWRQAYLYSSQGVEQKVLTPEGIDVTAVYGVNEKTQTLYYQAAPQPSTRHIYALNIKKGEISQLTKDEGMWSARFNSEATKAVFCYQSFETPNTYYLYSKNKLELIEDNAEVKAAWQANGLPEPEMMQINGLEAMLLRSPVTGNPSPLILMHYSGPASQRVLNRWRKRFEYALVELGYAVLIVDTRGGDCKGRAWRNETYMSLGQKEAEDLIMAANEMAKRDDIDGEHMAIMGWSYGGYETLYTMSQKNHPFKCGVAIAPVTEWKLYDSAYTERYMRRPQVNPRGYEEASLLNKAADLSGSVLIIHGTGDDNVHVQHTMQYINALVEADKQFEMQLYPDDNHHLRQGNNAKHMHNRILNFLQNNLKQ